MEIDGPPEWRIQDPLDLNICELFWLSIIVDNFPQCRSVFKKVMYEKSIDMTIKRSMKILEQ